MKKMENKYTKVKLLRDSHMCCESGGGNIFRKGQVLSYDSISKRIKTNSGSYYIVKPENIRDFDYSVRLDPFVIKKLEFTADPVIGTIQEELHLLANKINEIIDIICEKQTK